MQKLLFFTLTATLLIACNNDRQQRGSSSTKGTTIDADTVKIKPVVAEPIVDVYIENTASMDGYLKGDTRFKNAISYLLVQLDNYYIDSVRIHLINNETGKTTMTQVDLGNFANVIDLIWMQAKKKNRGDTDLNLLFKDILAETDDRTIAILFADCVYSPGVSTDGKRVFQKNATIKTFNDKLRENSNSPFATTIIKMNSQFKGSYFPRTGNKEVYNIEDDDRPYYITIIANQNIMNDFNKKPKLKVENLPGFENKYVLSPEDAKSIYYSVLQSTYNIGRFKPDRKKRNKDFIRGIEDVDLRTSGGGCTRGKEEPLSFAVAVDFSNIQAEDDYLRNPTNYTVTTNNFSIDSIIPAEKNRIKPNDWNRIATANPTHIIIMTAKTIAVSDVAFVLKKQIPQWIEKSNIEEDTKQEQEKLKEGKTFGLKYWVEGITEAYETIYPNDKNFFECSISISI